MVAGHLRCYVKRQSFDMQTKDPVAFRPSSRFSISRLLALPQTPIPCRRHLRQQERMKGTTWASQAVSSALAQWKWLVSTGGDDDGDLPALTGQTHQPARRWSAPQGATRGPTHAFWGLLGGDLPRWGLFLSVCWPSTQLQGAPELLLGPSASVRGKRPVQPKVPLVSGEVQWEAARRGFPSGFGGCQLRYKRMSFFR